MIDLQIHQTIAFGHGTCFLPRHAERIGCGRAPVIHVPGQKCYPCDRNVPA